MIIKNNNFVKLFIITIIIFASILSLYLYFEFFHEDEPKDIPIKTMDDRISPLTNQTVFLEIHRIRKKGIIDQMFESGLNLWEDILDMGNFKITSDLDRYIQSWKAFLEGVRPGFGWDDKPTYYFSTIIDGFEWGGRPIYRNWDTGYVNQVVFRDVEEEQAIADVEFMIIEKVEEGSLLRKNIVEREMERFKVTYDFRTGRWDGYDSFNDSDGYGHYNGSNYEVWFSLSQTSYDGDDIPFWTEVNILNTNPKVDDSKQDPDDDGITTEWEWKWGYNPFKWNNHTFLDPDEDGIQNIEEYQISYWLSNPYHPEMYIECDWMEQTPRDRSLQSPDGWTHEFYKESQGMIIERFNQHGITVHIDDGCMDGGGDLIPFDSGGEGQFGDFGQEVGVPAGIYDKYFTKNRKGIFRYLAICYKGGWCHPQDNRNCYDCMFVPHRKDANFRMHAGSLNERTKRIAQAVSMLHELGHSCGFSRGLKNSSDFVDDIFSFERIKIRNLLGIYPNRDITVEEWDGADYVSVMNYEYYFYSYFDYSDGTHGPHDTDDWAYLDLSFFQVPSPAVEGLA